jgi:DNA-directed RNA polymerase specialized sigma24 family protein
MEANDDWLSLQLQREAILDAIRKISNRRYRIVLLLIYLYELDNTELAAFFGVTVPQITTWKSRARKALREHYTSPHTSPQRA